MARHNTTRMLCEGAIFVALAQILGYLKIWHMPQGGSVSLMMLPILLFAFRWGLTSGLTAGAVLGILQFMLDGGIAIGWQSILGDYVIACALIGLAGVFARKGWGYFPALLLGGLARYAVIVATGAILWGVYMPDEFMGMVMRSEWVYSLLYNLPIAVSVAAALVAGGALYAVPLLRKYLLGQDIT